MFSADLQEEPPFQEQTIDPAVANALYQGIPSIQQQTGYNYALDATKKAMEGQTTIYKPQYSASRVEQEEETSIPPTIENQYSTARIEETEPIPPLSVLKEVPKTNNAPQKTIPKTVWIVSGIAVVGVCGIIYFATRKKRKKKS